MGFTVADGITCDKCIFSEPITDDKFSKDSVTCKRLERTTAKGKNSWCGFGQWQIWYSSKGLHDIPSQWSCYSWGEWEKESQ